MEKTWEQLVEDNLKQKDQKIGIVYEDWFDEGVRCLIMNGGGSLCAYVGVPISHPIAGFDYDSLPLDAHGGLTFSGNGDGTFRPAEYWWYGWDYAHSGDYCFYRDIPPLSGYKRDIEEKKWLIKDVKDDMWDAIYNFKKLIKLAERIAEKAKIAHHH